MSVLFMYPGQGAQRAGMLHALPHSAAIQKTLDEASEILARDSLTLDSPTALRSTVAVQLCLLIAGVAMTRELVAHHAGPQIVAGLSIGAWPAAVATGVLDFKDAVRLVQRRASLMEDAWPSGMGMTAIIGLSESDVTAMTTTLRAAGQPAYVANINADRQIVVAGSDAALQALAQQALAAGASAAKRLDVAVPSHCALLSDQARTLSQEMSSVLLQPPTLPYISSSQGRRLIRSADIGEDLAQNMARQVRWHDTIVHAYERGARLAVEMPGGGALYGLARAVFGAEHVIDAETTSVSSLAIHIQRASIGM